MGELEKLDWTTRPEVVSGQQPVLIVPFVPRFIADVTPENLLILITVQINVNTRIRRFAVFRISIVRFIRLTIEVNAATIAIRFFLKLSVAMRRRFRGGLILRGDTFIFAHFQRTLILTTNRLNDCDPAFESKPPNRRSTKNLEGELTSYLCLDRIHVSVNYRDLDARARKKFWNQFITKTYASSGVKTDWISDEDVQRLARHEKNGRQVGPNLSSFVWLSSDIVHRSSMQSEVQGRLH